MSIVKDSPDSPTDSTVLEGNSSFFCFYTNNTPAIQVLCLLDSAESWERVIFSQERLLFEATENSKLEVQTSQGSCHLIPCVNLKIKRMGNGK